MVHEHLAMDMLPCWPTYNLSYVGKFPLFTAWFNVLLLAVFSHASRGEQEHFAWVKTLFEQRSLNIQQKKVDQQKPWALSKTTALKFLSWNYHKPTVQEPENCIKKAGNRRWRVKSITFVPCNKWHIIFCLQHYARKKMRHILRTFFSNESKYVGLNSLQW